MLKAILLVLAMATVVSLVPLIMWQLAGERRLRHVDGPKGFLRDTALFYGPWLQVFVVIVIGAVWAAVDPSDDAALPLMLMMGSTLLSVASESFPVVKRARLRLDATHAQGAPSLHSGVPS
ncbi:MAG: hypothetical protein DCF28_06450 [Alphaproteobacteria bacterium]|nr:MAG: hypothetical protein DCF28_06450 [Alphaproteobacteria bacterium]PZO32928.1 MAG: hypothetical protein DCE92_13690 [Alphaproteobacteria bacterium]